MARSLYPQPANWRRIYFDLPSDVADALKVQAAKDRTYVKQLLNKIVTDYLTGVNSGKQKK
jgi:hypothetical protein